MSNRSISHQCWGFLLPSGCGVWTYPPTLRLLYYLPMERMNKDQEKTLGEQVLGYIDELEEENRKLKETIKDHQLYEEKLEHRIIELEELLHGE